MSQNSLVIADGTGAQVLTAINNALDTLKTVHSGATAPGSPSAYQLWADTTAGVMKMRNAANTAWLPIFRLDGVDINVAKTVTGGSYTLTEAEGLATSFEFSGTLTSNMVVVVPNNMPCVSVENLTTGGFTLTVKTAAGAGVVIGQGATALIYCNGTNCEEVSQRQATQMLSAANQVLTTTAATKVILGTALFNSGGNTADTTNNRFTCVVPGNYIVSCQIEATLTAAVQTLYLRVYKNGVAIGPLDAQSNNVAATTTINLSLSAILALAAGDFIEIFATASLANGPTLLASSCYLMVERV